MKRTISTSLIALLPITFAACGGSGGGGTGDCTPGAGANKAQYVTDTVTVPIDHTKFAIDVNGDGRPDNQLGYIIGALIGQKLDVQTGVNDAITMGKLIILNQENSADASFQADPCASSALSLGAVMATPDYTGNGTFTVDKSAGGTFAGPITNGKFDSASPVTTKSPVSVEIKLPLIAGADPVTLDIQGAHIQYTRNSAGKLTGGEIHGIIPKTKVDTVIIPNVASLLTFKMMDGTPAAAQIKMIFDNGGQADKTNTTCTTSCQNPDKSCAKANDGKIDICEVSTSGIIQNVLSPDVKMFDASGNWAPSPNAAKADADSLSLGIGFTMVGAKF